MAQMVLRRAQLLVDRWRPGHVALAPAGCRLVGLVSAVVLTIASWLCGAVPRVYPSIWPGVLLWRPNGSPLACTFVFLAVGGLLYAWWSLRDVRLTVRWHRRTAALWFGPLLLSAPLFSRDVYSYAAQGLMLHLGANPYREGVRHAAGAWASSVSRVWLNAPTPYGPLFLTLARGAAAVSSGHLLVALAVLRLEAVCGVIVIVWAVPVIARRVGTDPVQAAWLGCLSPLLGVTLVSGAHNDALMIAGVVGALALALGGHHVGAAWAGAAAVAVKAPVVVVLPFLAILAAVDHGGARPRTWSGVVGRSLVSFGGALAAFLALDLATGLGFGWLANLGVSSRSIQWTALPTGLGMGIGAVGKLLLGDSVRAEAVALTRGVAAVVLAATLVVIWLRAVQQSQDRRMVVLLCGQALLAVLVLSAVFQPWYFLWALPILAASLTDRRGRTAVAVVASLLGVAALPGGFSIALDTAWLGVPLCYVAAAVLSVKTLGWVRRYRWRELLTLAPAPAREGGPGRDIRHTAGPG